GVVEAVGRSDARDTGRTILEGLAALTPAVRPVALRVLLAKPDWTGQLIDAIEQGNIPLADLSLDQKQGLANHPDKTIAGRARARLGKGGGLPDADRQKVVEELLPLVKQTGDPALGKEMFKKHCTKCHVHSGEGTRIGPDLTGMAVHPKEELLIHIIDPSRN